MLKKELSKKSQVEIQKIFRFWGVSDQSTVDELIRHMTRKEILAHSCLLLTTQERALLYALLLHGGLLIKGELHKMYESDTELDETLESLAQKGFVYLRKDRSLLNDRLDKVYLFPELLKKLQTYRVYGPRELLNTLSHIVGDRLLLPESHSHTLRKLVMHGGVVPAHREQIAAFIPLQKKKYVEIVFVADRGTFIPVWALTQKAGERHTVVNNRPLSFGQSLYLHDIVKSVDCLMYLSLKKTHAQKTFSTCLKFAGGEARKNRLLRDLELLGILQQENEHYRVDESFAKTGYSEKVSRLKAILSEDERRVLMVLKKNTCTRESLFSQLMRERVMKSGVSGLVSEAGTSESFARYADSFENLVFRGLVLCDTTGAWVRANTLQKNVQSGDGSVIVNTNRELMVFADRISHFHLYVLAGFSHIVQWGDVMRLSVDRDSVSRGVEYIGDVARFSEVLRRTAGNTVNEGMLESIDTWSASKIDVQITRTWVLSIDSEKTRLKLLQNRYIQTHIERAFDTLIVLKAHTDVQRLKRELRKEHIFIRIGSQ
jgi:hypothetical protein